MIILEFTQDRVKLLEVARKGQRVAIATLSKRAIGGLSDEKCAGAVSDLLKEAGIRKGSSVVLCCPRHLFTVRTLRLPSLDDKELKAMAGLQAGKQLPYPATELVWDFKAVEKRPDGYSDVLLVLGHRNVIDRFLGILNKADLKADRICVSSEALAAWSIAAGGFKSDEEAGQQIKAVVEVDTAHIDIVILKGHTLEFSRSFPFRNELEEMAQEVRKTFSSYQKESSRTISSVVLTGIEERAIGLKGLLEEEELGGRIEFVHPLKSASMDYRETLSEYFDLSRDCSFACSLGIAFLPSGIKMDFLPPELKEKRAQAEKKRRFIKTTALVGAVCFILFGIFIKGLADKKQQLNLVDVKIRETEPKVKRLREMARTIELIKQSLDMRGSSVDVIREIFKLVPQEVSISVLDIGLDKGLTVRGISTDLSSVFKFASALDKSAYFEKYEIKYAQKRVVKGKEFVDFEITSKLSRQIR